MDNKSIYNALISAGLSKEGACGLMGNFQAESAMRSNNVQDGMTRLSDDEYTKAADNDSINFVRDAVGYGLAQWTYWSRKNALLSYAKTRGVSVGDAKMQIDFCIRELKTDYKTVWDKLCGSISVYDAASIVCTQYERPAVNNIAVRARFAEKFYSQFAKNSENSTGSTDKNSDTQVCTVQLPVLKIGSKGFEVWLLQILLNKHECHVKWTDGDFGENTLGQVKAFQKAKGLTVDGIVGAKTWAALIKG